MRRIILFSVTLVLAACSAHAPAPGQAHISSSAASAAMAVSSAQASAGEAIVDPALAAQVDAASAVCVTRTMAEAKAQNKDAPAEMFDSANKQLSEAACGIIRSACVRGARDRMCVELLQKYHP